MLYMLHVVKFPFYTGQAESPLVLSACSFVFINPYHAARIFLLSFRGRGILYGNDLAKRKGA